MKDKIFNFVAYKEISGTFLVQAILALKLFWCFFALIIFGSFTPLVDNELYFANNWTTGSVRDFSVSFLAFNFSQVIGSFLTNYLFGIFSITGIFYYILSGGRKFCYLIVGLMPSLAIWSSIVGKEAIFVGVLGVILVFWMKMVSSIRLSLWEITFVFVCLCGAFLFRPHYGLGILWLLFSGFLIVYGPSQKKLIMLMVFVVGALVFFTFVWDELVFRGHTYITPEGRSSRFDLLGIRIHTSDEVANSVFTKYLPLGFIFGIVGPLPVEVFSRIEFIPFFFEGLLVLCFPFLSRLCKTKYEDNDRLLITDLFWWSLVPSILVLMVVHAPFGVLNPGSAIRWRVNFELIFLWVPLFLTFGFKRFKLK